MRSSGLPVSFLKHYGAKTANAGTAFTRLIEPCTGMYTLITLISYTAGATGHTLTALRPLGRAKVASDAAASQAVVALTVNPGDYSGTQVSDNNPSASDFFVVQLDDGTYHVGVTSSWDGTGKAVTFNASLPYAASAGNNVWFLGVTGDSNPVDGAAHAAFTMPSGETTLLGSASEPYGVLSTFREFDPILLHSNNASNAGSLDRVTVVYTAVGGDVRRP